MVNKRADFIFGSENHMNEKPNMSDMAKTHVAY